MSCSVQFLLEQKRFFFPFLIFFCFCYNAYDSYLNGTNCELVELAIFLITLRFTRGIFDL